MGRWTVALIQKLTPQQRLIIAAYSFWFSILAGTFCTIFVARSWFERILMLISWGAITYTAWDIIMTADVREEVANGGS